MSDAWGDIRQARFKEAVNRTPTATPMPKPMIRIEKHYTAYNCSWGDGPIDQKAGIINLFAVPVPVDWPVELNANSFHRAACLRNWARGRLNSYESKAECREYLKAVLTEVDRMERKGLLGH